jgi:hypothetical protein
MHAFGIFHWLVIVAIVIIFFFGRRISEVLGNINRRGGPPTHPIPATGPIETCPPRRKSASDQTDHPLLPSPERD